MISSTANQSDSIYGVDGSPMVKDIYYGGSWKTVLISGTRQGGHSYFALDVTDPANPLHLFTFSHNNLNSQVSYWDSAGVRTDYSTASTIPAEYDFSELGESWSQPEILRLPVGAAGAMTWVAVFGGGFNAGISTTYGAQFYIINLEDGGKIIQNIAISDDNATNGIATSVPTRIMAITPDSNTSFQGAGAPAGAVIYFSDLEGKLWKINLTDQGTLYETAKLFDTEADSTNTRYTFHENAASMDSEGNLWQYYGTGDQQSLGDIGSNIANRGYAYKHSPAMTDFSATSMSTISSMTNVSAGICPSDAENGWYLNLDSNEKITAKASAKNSYIYFSRYTPDAANICSSGTAKVSEHAYTCGTIVAEFSLGNGVPTETIIYKNKIYLGISTDQAATTLPSGWVKDGNLIVGTPTNANTGKVNIEAWWEVF